MNSSELADSAPFSTPPPVGSLPLNGRGYFGLIDSILRRREDFFAEIFEGRNLRATLRMFVVTIAVLSLLYGVTMGASSFGAGFNHGFAQMISSGIKVPALYLLTVAICFPALFIILVLMGSKLTFTQTLSLILLALTLNSILLAACAPIVFFFIITGSSYDFVKVLHVGVMAFSGAWAMSALWHGLREMCEKSNLYPRQAIRMMQIWILVFGFVGTQMAWSLRPFVGSPGRPFTMFRGELDGNFYSAVAHSIGQVFKSTKGGPNARD